MTTIESFINRLAKIEIHVELFSNRPWIYLDRVNGKKVDEPFLANHGFTVFFLTMEGPEITDIPTIFKKIREMICQQEKKS